MDYGVDICTHCKHLEVRYETETGGTLWRCHKHFSFPDLAKMSCESFEDKPAPNKMDYDKMGICTYCKHLEISYETGETLISDETGGTLWRCHRHFPYALRISCESFKDKCAPEWWQFWRRMKNLIAAMAVLLVAITMSAAAASQTRSSVVDVMARDVKTGNLYRGTGFFIRRNLVITNHHVVNPRDENNVVVVIDNRRVKGIVTAENEEIDLAIVEVKGEGRMPFGLCNSVAAIGNNVRVLTYDASFFVSKKCIVIHDFVFDTHLGCHFAAGNSGSPIVTGYLWNKCVVGIARSGKNDSGLMVSIWSIEQFMNAYDRMVSKEEPKK